MAKLITWDATNGRYKEVQTGLVLSATSEPVTITNGDLWIDTDGLTLNAHVGGTSHEIGGLQ